MTAPAAFPPTITIVGGELSDSAIAALARILLAAVEADQDGDENKEVRRLIRGATVIEAIEQAGEVV